MTGIVRQRREIRRRGGEVIRRDGREADVLLLLRCPLRGREGRKAVRRCWFGYER